MLLISPVRFFSSSIVFANFQVARNAFCNFQDMLLLCLDHFYAMLLGKSYLFLKVSVQYHLFFEVFSGPTGLCFS